MTDANSPETDLNAADAANVVADSNPIAQPLVIDPAPDANDDLVQIESTADGVVFVTINRPAKRNAFDAETIAALYEAFETLHGADTVRVVFIRGAGGTFSAGADLGWMATPPAGRKATTATTPWGWRRCLRPCTTSPALTCAIVEGAAMGGGAGIVAACDMAVGVEGAASPSPRSSWA
jgi:methylglutaconyl-CoA hydratase